ncbi:hypothetical protein K490DRAFT_66861 [Saccharata proteae CBS 121410]|uniref:Jacalin-type lectin domain-containing protein n=1 Tax=Saccharata proteae CBS 121410 TaxID=1314787 RepID=A0A9P4LWC6_9PEZI|nr:hypothetical protein K490DRAFT_66861 [Saccharata proteae CBS 121410]
MPSFLKDFRRRSTRSFRTNNSSSDGSNGSANPLPQSKSSSTLNSVYYQTTPPPSLPSENSSTNLKALNGGPTPVPPVPTRPTVMNTKRYSMTGTLNGLGSPPPINGNTKPNATSLIAPRITSISDRSIVHQKVLLVSGQIGEAVQKPIDGNITVNHDKDSFPSVTWPVCDSHFKVLVHLQPGPNLLRFDFFSPKVSASNTSIPAHSSWINITYLPLNASPPLHLAIILAKDSPETYDAMPERVQHEGNGLETAVRKFRMAAYLWQAFTGEQMYRNGFGRRCWRYEEEWQQGTLTQSDVQTGQYRNEAKIHIIRTEKTTEELRDLNKAQQYDKATDKGALFGIAMDAVKAHLKPRPGQKQYVSCMFLDTHWDPKKQVVRAHAALGGGDGEVGLAIFGSHALQSYPASIEEVQPAFSDCTRTDTKYVANDCNESGSNWEAANIGIGAHLHETGHLFGCPHQESGVMLRDYVRLNRTYTTREPYSTRTKSPGQRFCGSEDECAWHRLDTLRFRFHPCFRLPADAPQVADDSVQVWTVDNANILVTAATGIAWMELYPQGDDVCHTWIEHIDSNGCGPRQISLTEGDLRSRLPSGKQKKPLKVEIFSVGGGKHVIEDLGALQSKASRTKLPDGRNGYKGSKLGFSQMEGSEPQEVLLECAFIQTKLLLSVKVYHGFAVDGIEFFYEDLTSQLFGKRGGTPGGTEFQLDIRRGELIMGFYLRAGLWIDGIQILTSLGRKSPIFGNPVGGSGHTLIPPRGYTIAGLSGSCGQWMDGFSLIITR